MNPRTPKIFSILIVALFCVQIISVPRHARAQILGTGDVSRESTQLIHTIAAITGWISDIKKTVHDYFWEPFVPGFPGSSVPAKLTCAISATLKGTIGAIALPPGIDQASALGQELLGQAIGELSQKAGDEGLSSVVVTTLDDNALLGCIAANTSILAEKAVKNDVRDSLLKVISRAILRLTIQEIKRSTINFIATGNLNAPTFITSFTGDPKLAAENAIRGFLSQVSNINFCNFFPPVIPATYSLNFNFYLQCSLTRTPADAAWLAIRDLYNWEPSIRTTLSLPQNNYSQVVADIAAGKINNAAQASVSLLAEAIAGGGYLSIKSPRFLSQNQDVTETVLAGNNGPCGAPGDEDETFSCPQYETRTIPNAIQIPGKTVGELVSSQLFADALGPEIAREIDDAIVEIAVFTVQKVVDQGLNAIFR